MIKDDGFLTGMSRLRNEYRRLWCEPKEFEANPCYLSELAQRAAEEMEMPLDGKRSLEHTKELLEIIAGSDGKVQVSQPYLDAMEGLRFDGMEPPPSLSWPRRYLREFFADLSSRYERYWWDVWRRRGTD